MAIEGLAIVAADQARVDAAQLRVAEAMGQQQVSSKATPGEVEHSYAAVGVARAELAAAEAQLAADQSSVVRTDPSQASAQYTAGINDPAQVQHNTEVLT